MAVVEIRSKLDLGKYHGWVSVEKKKKRGKVEWKLEYPSLDGIMINIIKIIRLYNCSEECFLVL